MNSKDVPVEVALLEIAKDLLQASDDLAATDPSASAKLAHEAYEIGRDLGIVRNHLDSTVGAASAKPMVIGSSSVHQASASNGASADHGASLRANGSSSAPTGAESHMGAGTDPIDGLMSSKSHGDRAMPRLRDPEDDADDELFRILDRQRAVVPNHGELAPTRKSRRNAKQIAFEVATPRRSGWFSWMRSRDLHHAG